MSPVVALFLSLLLRVMLGIIQVSAETMTWYPASIHKERLSSGTSSSLQSKLLCAILATNKPSTNLFIYDSGTCSLYEQKIKSYEEESALGTTTPCWTKYHKVCFYGDGVYLHGEEFEEECRVMICWEGDMISKSQVAVPCGSPFTMVEGLGCLYLHEEENNFCKARFHCSSLFADLAVPQDFSILQEHLLDRVDTEIWVGVEARKWLNGREVTLEEWHSNDPDGGPNYCARLRKDGNKHFLGDIGCSKTYIFLCQRNVQ